MEGGVDVIKQAVTDVDGLAGGHSNALPAIELLWDVGGQPVVVAVEGLEGTEHGPASAEGLGGVVAKTADVGADHGDLEDGGEVEHTSDSDAVAIPRADVVTEPFSDLAASAGEGAAGDDQGALCGAAEFHGFAGGDRHHWVG